MTHSANNLSQPSNEWQAITPQVNAEAEFFEIVNDFGNPLELLREAVSNSFDAHAKNIDIEFRVDEVEGKERLIVEIRDDGQGMTREVLSTDFWGLGFSRSRDRKDAIGEKGHGTKIFLRSDKVQVRTQSAEGAYESVCERPQAALSQRKLHAPIIRQIPQFLDKGTGTHIHIMGYNNDECARFIQEAVRDYLYWYTRIGSIEHIFGNPMRQDCKVTLKCLDADAPEIIPLGHPFPEENADIDKLFHVYEGRAADLYVRRYIWPQQRLKGRPDVVFDVAISVEGDEAKRKYNPMIRERRRGDRGRYKVADRYGIWLCKDFIPITRVNEWIPAFGSGSNAFVLLHGFVNCQKLKLTANRGSIANTDTEIYEELKTQVENLVREVDDSLNNQAFYTLREMQLEDKTIKVEKKEYEHRTKSIRNRRRCSLQGRILLEPQNESELFGLFMMIYSEKPELFDFEPLDYNTTKGLDVIARNKGIDSLRDDDLGYVELKYNLRTRFNHAFRYLRWIICWDFDKSVNSGSSFEGVEEKDIRQLEASNDDENRRIYFLSSKKKPVKIQVIRLKELLEQRLGLKFEMPEGT